MDLDLGGAKRDRFGDGIELVEVSGCAKPHVEFEYNLFTDVGGISKILGKIYVGEVGEVTCSCDGGCVISLLLGIKTVWPPREVIKYIQ